MYAALWRLLPGPVWLRVLLVLVLISAVLALLANVVFPAVDAALFPSNEVVTPATR